MAGTSVLKLKVDDKEYNASLRDAQRGMQHLEKTLQDAGKTFNQVDKAVVNYVRGIGQMEAQSKTARGRIGEMSNAFVELSMQYNKMSDDVKRGDVGKALAESMENLKQRTIAAKQELQDLNRQLDNTKMPDVSGGGFLSGMGDKLGGAMQVFAGNMMTKVAGAVAELGSEMMDTVKQGIELAKQGEGIRIAFERLGRGDILDGLREATHGTVTDLELMKAAVKFNDFKLPVEELGTMLAFAQQKAKDTGQSVDYMVDSIVTGLGRKSLMILDNLGLSANEIKEKMKQTGDMTKAVGEIIREQMAKAGDYVETAADRAAQANVSLQNKMEELGRKFAPVEEASNQLWTSMKIAILDVVGGPLARLLNGLTEAGRMKNMLDQINGSTGTGQTHSGKTLGMLRNYRGDKQDLYNRQVARYAELEEKAWRQANEARRKYNEELKRDQGRNKSGLAGTAPNMALTGYENAMREAEARAKAYGQILSEYKSGAKDILNPNVKPVTPVNTNDPAKKGGGRKTARVTTPKVETPLPVGSVAALNKELSELRKQQELATDTAGWQEQQQKIDELTSKIKILKGEIPDPSKIQQGGGTSVLGIGIGQAELDNVQKQLDGMLPDEGLKIPAKIEINKEELQSIAKEGTSTAKSWQDAASAIGQVGSAIQSIEDPAAKVAGIVAQAIATVAMAYAQTLAQDNSSKSNIWAFIAAAAAASISMATTIASIHNATGYAQGGIVDGSAGGFVPGNSYSGDNVGNVRLNSGELVLNASQQNNLANGIRGNSPNMNLRAVVSGEQLVLVADRWGRRSGKGEIVFWK